MRRFTIGHQNPSDFDTKYTHNRLKNPKNGTKKGLCGAKSSFYSCVFVSVI